MLYPAAGLIEFISEVNTGGTLEIDGFRFLYLRRVMFNVIIPVDAIRSSPAPAEIMIMVFIDIPDDCSSIVEVFSTVANVLEAYMMESLCVAKRAVVVSEIKIRVMFEK
jgi:hypothetical protein